MNVSIAQGGNSGQAGRTMNEELKGTPNLHAAPMRHLNSAPAGAWERKVKYWCSSNNKAVNCRPTVKTTLTAEYPKYRMSLKETDTSLLVDDPSSEDLIVKRVVSLVPLEMHVMLTVFFFRTSTQILESTELGWSSCTPWLILQTLEKTEGPPSPDILSLNKGIITITAGQMWNWVHS